jgi:endoglucanase
MAANLEPVKVFRAKYNAPVVCNEFGVYVGGADRESQLRWLTDLTDILRESDIGYSYWNYKNLDFGITSQGERLFQNYERYANPERTDYALADLLRKA